MQVAHLNTTAIRHLKVAQQPKTGREARVQKWIGNLNRKEDEAMAIEFENEINQIKKTFPNWEL